MLPSVSFIASGFGSESDLISFSKGSVNRLLDTSLAAFMIQKYADSIEQLAHRCIYVTGDAAKSTFARVHFKFCGWDVESSDEHLPPALTSESTWPNLPHRSSDDVLGGWHWPDDGIELGWIIWVEIAGSDALFELVKVFRAGFEPQCLL